MCRCRPSLQEWEHFLGKSLAPGLQGGARPPWVREESARAFEALVRAFPEVASTCNFQGLQDQWAAWAISAKPEASHSS